MNLQGINDINFDTDQKKLDQAEQFVSVFMQSEDKERLRERFLQKNNTLIIF